MNGATQQIEMRPVAGLKPYPGNARQHSKKQVRQIADSITRFGFANPVLIGDDGEIVAGHGRVMAAKELGLDAVPTLRLSHLSVEERRAYVLADNKLALNAGCCRIPTMSSSTMRQASASSGQLTRPGPPNSRRRSRSETS